ncbi:MAG: hypothetical protein LBQ81_07275 [Zoogloeaceae bacterium]|jgi:hypothetical protein|nr:hypothetical protein [Zoogloeaceae bacterium]
MRVIEKQFNDTLKREIEIRELTLGEIRAWLRKSETKTPDVVSTLLVPEDGIDVVLAATDISGNELEVLTPSEIKTVATAVKALNADFFALPGRLMELVDSMKTLEAKPPAPGLKKPV